MASLSSGHMDLQVNASWCKFAKPDLVYGFVIGGQTDSQVGSQIHASLKSCKLCIYTVDLWSVYVDLHWVGKWWKACVDLRTNLSSTKVNASHCKSKQVGGQTKHKLNANQKLALTCKSIWPGLKLKTKTKKPQWTYMQAACYVTDIPPGVLLVLEPKPHLCQGLERNDVNQHVMLWDSDYN